MAIWRAALGRQLYVTTRASPPHLFSGILRALVVSCPPFSIAPGTSVCPHAPLSTVLSQISPVSTPHESSLRHDERAHNHKLHRHKPFETNSRSQHWQTMTRVLYISCISETILKFWTWHDNALPKRSCKHTWSFLQKHSTLNLQWWKLRLKRHTCYVLHYFKFSPLLADILADIFLNMFLTSLPRHSLWTSFRRIFWHSWHIFDHSFWHVLSELLADISSDLSCDILQRLLWHTLSAPTTNPFDRSWGPTRHTELAWSQLRSGTPHSTHGLPVGVRHATLNSRPPSWGPARHTELTSSRLGSGTPHWTHELAVEVRDATLNTRARSWGPTRHTEHKIVVEARQGGGGRGRGDGRGGEEETDIKSNNPHLTGGEKQVMLYIPFPKHPISLYICFVSMLSYSVWIQTVT